MFSQPRVKQLLGQYVRVQLYTDAVPARYQPTTSAQENLQFMYDKFGEHAQLPLYVILKPEAGGAYQVVAIYREGKINSVEGFLTFLQKPLAADGADRRVQATGFDGQELAILKTGHPEADGRKFSPRR